MSSYLTIMQYQVYNEMGENLIYVEIVWDWLKLYVTQIKERFFYFTNDLHGENRNMVTEVIDDYESLIGKELLLIKLCHVIDTPNTHI